MGFQVLSAGYEEGGRCDIGFGVGASGWGIRDVKVGIWGLGFFWLGFWFSGFKLCVSGLEFRVLG